MNVLYTDYSRLFSAGLRVIESRRTPRRPHLASLSVLTHTSSHASSDSPAPSPPPTKPAPAPWKRLWRRSTKPPAAAAAAAAAATPTPAPPTHPDDADLRAAKRARRRTMPARVVEDTALDVRIWDWSARVPRLAEEDADDGPRDADKADPVLTPSPARTAILVALPAPACDDNDNDDGGEDAKRAVARRERRVSAQTLPVRAHQPYCAPAPAAEDFWDSDSSEDDEEEGEGDEDEDARAWRTFRVEWIDFD